MTKRNGTYYLQYSAPGTEWKTYAVGVYTSKRPLGPFTYAPRNPSDATRHGIAFVHQELNLFDNLDVASNIFIGREPRRYGPLQLVDTARLHGMVRPYLDRLGANFSPSARVAGLSLAQRQMVEIAKALNRDTRILTEAVVTIEVGNVPQMVFG